MKTAKCATCGMEFGLSDEFYDRRQQDGEGFSCPVGHVSVFSPSLSAILKRRIDELEKINNQLDEMYKHLDQQFVRICDENLQLKKDLGIQRRRVTYYRRKLNDLKAVSDGRQND